MKRYRRVWLRHSCDHAEIHFVRHGSVRDTALFWLNCPCGVCECVSRIDVVVNRIDILIAGRTK